MRPPWGDAVKEYTVGSSRRVAMRRRRRIIVLGARVVALLLAASSLVIVGTSSTDAVPATGGSGRFGGSIQWVTWGVPGEIIPAGGITKTETFTAGGQSVGVTCTISSLVGELDVYRSGSWSGDALDDLYNVGGTGGSNTLVTGLRNVNQGGTATFDFSCSGAINGQPFPLAGLVFADAEQSGSADEWIAATAPAGAVWRVIDRYRDAACIQSIQSTVSASNRIVLQGDVDAQCLSGPSVVTFLDGATQATNVTVQGRGLTAIALGVMVGFDRADAPASYGDPVHLLQPTWTGGADILTTATRVSDPSFTLATQNAPVLRFGAGADGDEVPFYSTSALGDSDDGLASPPSRVDAVPGASYTIPAIACAGTGKVAGWIDWNGNGQFDVTERSGVVDCAAGAASLVWTIPSDTVTSSSYVRLRIASDEASLSTATGLAMAGEVEDYALEVTLAEPNAVPDSITTEQNTPSTPLQPASNDSPNAVTSSALQPSTIRLLDGSTPVTSLATADGTFAVDPATGEVTFTPTPGYGGTTAAVTYRITDANNLSATSTITATVTPVSPTAQPDSGSASQGDTVTIDAPDNDQAGNVATPLDRSSVQLIVGPSGGTVSNGGKTLTVPGVGTFSASDTGVVTFAPLASFVGSEQIGYAIVDADGTPATSTITVTIVARAPVAVPDAVTTQQNTTVTLTPSDNDERGLVGGTPIDPTSTRLVVPVTGAATSSPVAVAGGTFSVNTATGVVSFVPTSGFTGTTTIDYEVADSLGETSRATITIDVEPVTPVAVEDSASVIQGGTVEIPVSDNDQPGNAGTPLDRTTVRLLDPGNGATLFGGGMSLVVPGEGTYTVVAATEGSIGFVPVSEFAGATTPISYRIEDVDGGVDTATVSVTVTAVPPRAQADAPTTEQNTPVTVRVLDNDETGIVGGSPLDPTTVVLLDGSAPVMTLSTPEGTFSVNPATGAVTFTPASGFTGPVPPVTYRVTDANGETSTSTISVTVSAVAPTATADSGMTRQGSPTTFSILVNDAAGNAQTPLDPTSLTLSTNGIVGAVVAPDGRELTVPGEGTFRVDAMTGEVTFTPLPTFTGLTSLISYTVADVDGATASSTIEVSVAPADLVARDDLGSGSVSSPVVVDPLANDDGGTGAPLDPTTVRLVDPLHPDVVVSPDGRSMVKSGVGTWTVDTATGEVTFVAAPGLRLNPPAVQYTVADMNGVTIGAALEIVLLDLPTLALTGLTPLRSLGLATALILLGLGTLGLRSAVRLWRRGVAS